MHRFRSENDPGIAAPRTKAKRVSDYELGRSAKVNREMAARFRKWLTAQNYLRSTVQKYGSFADAFCGYIKVKPLREVVPLDISDFITSNLPSRWTDTLVNDRLACLRSFFDFLYLGGAVASVPPRSIRPRKGKCQFKCGGMSRGRLYRIAQISLAGGLCNRLRSN